MHMDDGAEMWLILLIPVTILAECGKKVVILTNRAVDINRHDIDLMAGFSLTHEP
jgi:hypothetical protein